MKDVIPVYKPLIDDKTYSAAVEALKNGWLGMGSFVGQFEQAFMEYLNTQDRKCAAVSTGTAALHLAMLIADVGDGDEVITPSFNNIGDFQAILAVGAVPVFCDICEDDLGIDCDKAEPLITDKTKAIIALHYDGIPCRIDRVFELAKKHNLRVIEDDCHALGTYIKGKPAGSYGDIACFSFDAVKTITCIDGGMVVVNTQQELDLLHQYRLLGMSQPSSKLYANSRAWKYDVYRIGFRYHMANIHASIGLSQIDGLDKILDNRRSYCRFYNEQLKDIDGLTLPKTDFENVGPFMYYVVVKNDKRQELIDYLRERAIETGIHWRPGHQFSLFKQAKKSDMTVTERIGKGILTIPTHSIMKENDLKHITQSIRKFFGK